MGRFEAVTLANHARRQKRVLILVSDERRLPDPAPVMARLPAGTLVLLRHYGAPGREALARRLVRLARKNGQNVLVAGPDWRLAARIGAAGVHLPDAVAKAGVPAGLRLWRRGRLLSIACHDRAGLARAVRAGADLALLSPVFPTASHPGAPTLGPTRFALLARGARLPVVALGGVDTTTVRALRFAAGYAAIGGLA